MAHKKGQGSSTNGRDSQPKYLGIKRGNGSFVNAGTIILRQRGTKIRPGVGTGLGRDYTIYATVPGTVRFITKADRKYATVEEFTIEDCEA
ncbi:MAG: 50S ribosomal protein L27 [Synergistaceae bacterium]|nr:50S ribosomal protein L27 [Synergistaceae bacterium]